MMKNELMKGFEAGHLLAFDVDLRISRDVRLAEIGQRLADNKDELGKRHLSVNVAYLDGGKVKRINTSAYIREDDAAWYVCLLFAEGVTVNLLEEGVETAINVLEYRIDKYTEAVTEISRLDDESAYQGNVLFFDFGLIDPEKGLDTPALVESVLAQLQQIKNWSAPIMGRFKIRTNWEYNILASEVWTGSPKKVNIWFPFPATTSSPYLPDKCNFLVSYENDFLTMTEGLGDADFQVLFLTANSDYQIDVADNNVCLKGDWNRFYRMMKRGAYPGVYLKTLNNGGYYPAHYSFEPVEDAFRGKIGCLYIKDVDGVKKLVSDELVFDGTQAGWTDFSATGGVCQREYHEYTLS